MREGKCHVCRRRFTHAGTRGKVPKHCPEHRPGNHKHPERELAAKESREAAKTRAVVSADDRSIHRLAACLYMLPDDHPSAARRAGIDPDKVNLADCVELAERRHPGIVAGDRAALERMLFTAVALSLEEGIARLGEVAARDALNIPARLAQAITLLRSDAAPQWTSVDVYVDASEAPK